MLIQREMNFYLIFYLKVPSLLSYALSASIINEYVYNYIFW